MLIICHLSTSLHKRRADSFQVYVVWLAIETTVIYFVYPETKGPALEELSRLFEDEDPLVKGQLDLDGSAQEKGSSRRGVAGQVMKEARKSYKAVSGCAPIFCQIAPVYASLQVNRRKSTHLRSASLNDKGDSEHEYIR